MIFYTKGYQERLNSDFVFPCVILIPNYSWNDYGFITTFKSFYYTDFKKQRIEIGELKIIEKNKQTTVLPDQFEKLNDDLFCSLGQSIHYYQNLVKLENFDVINYLDSLNDIAYYTGIREKFYEEASYKDSLLRFTEANKALIEGRRIIEKVDIKNAFHFKFRCKLPMADTEHIVDFDFRRRKQLPNRVIAIIGKNGTGKTQFLATFANTLSGLNKNEGHFENDQRPVFSKIITVSYSLFDKFEIPKTSKTFSYVYCGLRDDKGIVDETKLIDRLKQSIKKIAKLNRARDWQIFLNEVIDTEILDYLYDEDVISLDKLSSGQSILIYVVTEIIANIDNESLILYDEPETHLHPNAASQIIDILYSILEKYNSYAIIATHSPIIIQEIPANYIYIFRRESNIPYIFKLGIESFGENLSLITDTIFENNNYKEFFKKYLEKLSEDLTYDEIVKMFDFDDKHLSLNAKIYLKSLYMVR